MRRLIRDQSISIFFGVLFAGSLVGQAIFGHRAYNDHAVVHGSDTISLGRYVVSSDYGQAVLENWQSEYLQFLLLILATMWFFERGSTESKSSPGRTTDKEEKVGRYATQRSPSWAASGGWRQTLYSYSLPILMGTVWLLSSFGQSVTGWTVYNDEQRDHDEPTVSWATYLTRPDFWEETLQNWQSEFLAVGSMAVFTIYLRARGSAESKKVGDPHDKTGSSD
jgi:hypothetical protein